MMSHVGCPDVYVLLCWPDASDFLKMMGEHLLLVFVSCNNPSRSLTIPAFDLPQFDLL